MHQTKNLRRTLIAIAQRRQKPGTGSSIALLTRRTAEVKWFDLTPVLAPLKWAVVGAVATRHYMAERTTKDLDVVIIATSAEKVRQKLQAGGLTYQGELAIKGSHWLTPDNQPIDVLEGQESWWNEAVDEAQNNHDLQGLPIVPLPYLILSKFKAGRLQDIADISRMLGGATSQELDKVRAIFTQHCTTDEIEDLESLITLGKLELGQP
jgi:hypothetical protein